jgi:hypothetical protein
MRRHIALSITLFCLASAAQADVVYQFAVNTSSISGTVGSFDLQFNPGPLVSQAASLQILDFVSSGTFAGAPTLSGDVSGGPLPATLTFGNSAAFNDYFEGFTFGSSLLFDVRLYGPAINSPNGTATSGSAFAFSMFSDAAGTIPALTTDLTDGFAALVSVNLGGTTAITDFSRQTSVVPVSAVPEPRGVALVGVAIAMLGLLRRSRWRLPRLLSRDSYGAVRCGE